MSFVTIQSVFLLAFILITSPLATISFAQNLARTCTSNVNMASGKLRSVKRVLPAPSPHWVGNGFHVYPVFADLAFTKELSPLLMFDYAAPKEFPPNKGAPLGVGQHPHRGFETVTIAFQGEVEHKDSTGKSGVIHPGDVQWMTAGRGIIHQEFHSTEFSNKGGTFEMAQLWVNLPKKDKMTKPRYQPIDGKKIPVVNLPLNNGDGEESVGSARIIAGEIDDTKGAAKTFSPVQLWDIDLPHAGAEFELPFPADYNCIVFVRRGAVEVLTDEKSSKLGPQDVAVMNKDGAGTLKLRVVKPDSSVLVMGGEPINELIAAQGPFVMNTNAEISQAIQDYRSGKMGR
jgi:redox-sensitive bicupin YhaK (pirin superfamily)